MFSKGTMRDEGIDVTPRGNPGHVLVPDDIDMFRKGKLHIIAPEEFEKWYRNLFVERWNSGRKDEIMQLMAQGKKEDIKLCCFCPNREEHCHANLAAKYLNQLISKMLSDDT
jgi:hypothetical protein